MTDLDVLESRAKLAIILASCGIGLALGCPVFILAAWAGAILGLWVNSKYKSVSQPTNALATTAIWLGFAGSIPFLIGGIAVAMAFYGAFKGELVPPQ